MLPQKHIKRSIRRYLLPNLNINPKRSILTNEVEMSRGIPKILHQTYPGKVLPKTVKKNVDQLRAINPDWEYRYYDDSDIVDFIGENYGSSMLEYYNRINPIYGAAKADLFRYLLIYKCGGAYLDIKSSTKKPLSEVLNVDDCYVLANWGNEISFIHDELKATLNGEFQQWHIVAQPGHPFLRAVIDNVLRNIDIYSPTVHGVGKHGVLRVTGPIAYSLAIAPILHLYKHRCVDYQSELYFEYSLFNNYRDHKGIFKQHYSQLSEPIIKIEGAKKVSEVAISGLKKFKDTFLPSL